MELRHQVQGQSIKFRAEFPDVPSVSRVPEVSAEAEPIQVGRMHLSAKECQRRLSEGLCLYCGGHGHLAASCPVKASAHQ